MSKNNFEILTEVYSGTSIGERIKKREQVISDYLNVYGQLILNKVLKPTPVMEHLAKKYNFSRCIVHQIRNSIKYVGSKHQKEFIKDLRTVYGAVNKDSAAANLDLLESKWGEMYPIVIKSWRDNWERLTEYFQYTPAIRKLIYTTNTVEGYHRQVRKVTKTKGVFPTDNSLEKLVYLAYRNIRKKWTMPLANWGQISQQLAIKFGDRFKIM